MADTISQFNTTALRVAIKRHFLRHTAITYGVATIAIIWAAFFYQLSVEYSRALDTSILRGGSIARLFEETTIRVIKSVDLTLSLLRLAYEENPAQFDLRRWAERSSLVGDLNIQASIIGPDGYIKTTTTGYAGPPPFIGDREHFLVQKHAEKDELYISKPVIGRASGKASIQLTRRLIQPDGNFGGVIVNSIDPDFVRQFHETMKLGPQSGISLRGLDGAVRAFYGYKPATDKMSKALADSIARAPEGHFWGNSNLEHVNRLVSYRLVAGYPLLVTVGETEEHVFADYQRHRLIYIVLAAVLTAMASLGVVTAIRRRHSFERANLRFRAAVENMSQGLCMFDAQQRLIVCNKRYAELYNLTEEQTKSGTTFRQILEYKISSGLAPENHEQYVRDRNAEVTANKPFQTTNQLRNGHYVSIVHQPMEGGGWVATHEDITGQRLAQEELDATKNFLNSIIENVPVAIVVKDAKTRKFVLANRTYEALVGQSQAELMGKTAFDLYGAEDAALMDRADLESLRDGFGVKSNDFEVTFPKRGARIFTTKRIIVRDGQNAPKFLIVVIDDITERKQTEQRIAFMAHHDALTGLANRVAVSDKIGEAAARQRRLGEPYTVMLLDLDRFKYVNDTLGHASGDILLREVATRLKELLRETDVLARLGGDEFAIIQSGEKEQRVAAVGLAGRIIEAFAKPFVIKENEASVGVSIGIALAPEHANDSDNLLKMADLALYRAKSSGRNGYYFFDAEMGFAVSARQELENELRRAIQQDQLELYYQPIIDAKTRKICSAEALVRWRHPTKGIIAPTQFIPLAEETGLITQIGEWALSAACNEASSWPADVKVAINLSAVQFRKSNLADVVMYALANSGLPPERLEIEITETALIESATECLAALRELKNIGISIALDDFGTGYSSLSQLTMFPFDKIKIDKSFTQNMTKRAECAAIISATLALAHSLDLLTTAEGVETSAQYKLLRMAGVTSVQGYLFAHPLPASKINFGAIFSGPAFDDAA